MNINLTTKKTEEINKMYEELRTNKRTGHVTGQHGLKVCGASVVVGLMSVCSVAEIKSLIAELSDMQKAIEEVTGIC